MLKLTRVAAVLLIGLAVILAIVAFWVSRRASEAAADARSAQTVSSQAQTWPVVEAVNRLPAGAPIQAQDLRVVGRPQADTGGYSSVTPLIGAVPVQDIAAGTVVGTGQIAQGFSLRLSPGERALAVPVDELVAAGNRIQPGDFVDVFVNLNSKAGYNSEGDAQARLLLSRLRVLSYGAQDVDSLAAQQAAAGNAQADGTADDSRAQDIRGANDSGNSSTANTAPARSAVLAVPIAEASQLLLAAQQGKLFLALRNPADIGVPDRSLFPQPAAVLSARRELSPEQRLALDTPENDAYAGIDADALAGRGTARRAPVASAPTPVRAVPRPDRGIEIIRGDVASRSGAR